MKEAVLDVNVFMHRCFKIEGEEANREAARSLTRAAYAKKIKLVVPQMFWGEFGTAMVPQRSVVDREVFEGNFALIRQMVSDRVLTTAAPTKRVELRAFDIARMEPNPGNSPASYLDATYHALAEDRGALFVTADLEIHKQGCRARGRDCSPSGRTPNAFWKRLGVRALVKLWLWGQQACSSFTICGIKNHAVRARYPKRQEVRCNHWYGSQIWSGRSCLHCHRTERPEQSPYSGG